MKDITINPNYKLQKFQIPGTSSYLIIIDEFLLDTQPIINFANNIAYFNPMFADKTLFPGMRDKMPMPYTRLLKSFFEESILPKIKGDAEYQSHFHGSLLSLVNCDPVDLRANQKMPHVDSCNSSDFAFVHYFSAKELGGTSFYRYKPQKIIQFTQDEKDILVEMLNDVISTPEEHSTYITGSTSVFDEVFSVEAKVNRLVIYPANVLHSANLISPRSYCGDIKEGRLSISSFASISKV
jgi:hypothetical protein